MKRCIERKDYIASRDRMYGIYLKWLFGIERTEQDFNDFYVAKERVSYYEGSIKHGQQRGAKRILEKVAED
jgi:hypothetical protein